MHGAHLHAQKVRADGGGVEVGTNALFRSNPHRGRDAAVAAGAAVVVALGK